MYHHTSIKNHQGLIIDYRQPTHGANNNFVVRYNWGGEQDVTKYVIFDKSYEQNRPVGKRAQSKYLRDYITRRLNRPYSFTVQKHNGEDVIIFAEAGLKGGGSDDRILGAVFGSILAFGGTLVATVAPPLGLPVAAVGANLVKKSVCNEIGRLDDAIVASAKEGASVAAMSVAAPIAGAALGTGVVGTAAATGISHLAGATTKKLVQGEDITPETLAIDTASSLVGAGVGYTGNVLGTGLTRAVGVSHQIVTSAVGGAVGSAAGAIPTTAIENVKKGRPIDDRLCDSVAQAATMGGATGALDGAIRQATMPREEPKVESATPAKSPDKDSTSIGAKPITVKRESTDKKPPAAKAKPKATSTNKGSKTSGVKTTVTQQSNTGKQPTAAATKPQTEKTTPATADTSARHAKTAQDNKVDNIISGFKKGHYNYKGKPLSNTDKKQIAAAIKSGKNPGIIKNKDGTLALNCADLANECRKVNAQSSTKPQPVVPSVREDVLSDQITDMVSEAGKNPNLQYKGKPVKGENADNLKRDIKSGKPVKIKNKSGKTVFDGKPMAKEVQQIEGSNQYVAEHPNSVEALIDKCYPYSRASTDDKAIARLRKLPYNSRVEILKQWISSYFEYEQIDYKVKFKHGSAQFQGQTKIEYGGIRIPLAENNKRELVHDIASKVLKGQPVGNGAIGLQDFVDVCASRLEIDRPDSNPGATKVAKASTSVLSTVNIPTQFSKPTPLASQPQVTDEAESTSEPTVASTATAKGLPEVKIPPETPPVFIHIKNYEADLAAKKRPSAVSKPEPLPPAKIPPTEPFEVISPGKSFDLNQGINRHQAQSGAEMIEEDSDDDKPYELTASDDDAIAVSDDTPAFQASEQGGDAVINHNQLTCEIAELQRQLQLNSHNPLYLWLIQSRISGLLFNASRRPSSIAAGDYIDCINQLYKASCIELDVANNHIAAFQTPPSRWLTQHRSAIMANDVLWEILNTLRDNDNAITKLEMHHNLVANPGDYFIAGLRFMFGIQCRINYYYAERCLTESAKLGFNLANYALGLLHYYPSADQNYHPDRGRAIVHFEQYLEQTEHEDNPLQGEILQRIMLLKRYVDDANQDYRAGISQAAGSDDESESASQSKYFSTDRGLETEDTLLGHIAELNDRIAWQESLEAGVKRPVSEEYGDVALQSQRGRESADTLLAYIHEQNEVIAHQERCEATPPPLPTWRAVRQEPAAFSLKNGLQQAIEQREERQRKAEQIRRTSTYEGFQSHFWGANSRQQQSAEQQEAGRDFAELINQAMEKGIASNARQCGLKRRR
ncbi:MAG: hypothetical protein CMF50_04710 [Legionellales bacterium]|nr:hypothetical protein [Legionellales bacterium]|tara:strand:- start:10645 stop:14538 length:3894 start_codon:yes stop_codon:yes gene_type:complete